MITAIRQLIGKISFAFGCLAAFILVPLIFASVYEVVSRYAFGRPTIWAYEVGYMAMGASFLLAAAYTLKCNAHVRIDVLTMTLPRRTKAALDLFGFVVLFLPIGIWLVFGLYEYMIEAHEWQERTGESAWNPLVWPYYAVFVVAFAVLVLQAIAEALGRVQILLGHVKEI